MNTWNSDIMAAYTRICSYSGKSKPDYAYSYPKGTANSTAQKQINGSTTTYQSSNEGIPLSQVT